MMVDLAWEPHAPIVAHAELFEVTLSLLSPDEDGLSDTSEAPRLFALEDRLAAGVAAGLNGWYVGRMTGKGTRVFYFYAPTSLDADKVVGRTLQNFPEYEWKMHHQHDPQWKLYRELLVPSEEEAHLIKNRRALDELNHWGDQHQVERPVIHQFRFDKQKNLDLFLRKIGLQHQAQREISRDNGDLLLKVEKTGTVIRSELDEITWDFAQIAKACRGQYLGWRSEVVTG